MTRPAPGPPTNTGPASTTGSTNGSTTSGPVSGTNVTGMQPGSTGTMGPPPGGGQYDLHNQTVLKHLLQNIVNQLAQKGDQGVAGACKAFTSTQAECEIRGANSSGQHFDNFFTLTVNLSNGQYTVTNVKPAASGMQPGSRGTMGPPPGGGRYNLHNGTVLKHLLQNIVNQLAQKGDRNVQGACKAFTSTQAECAIRGTNTAGQHFSNIFTLTVNLNTGQFTITHVRAA